MFCMLSARALRGLTLFVASSTISTLALSVTASAQTATKTQLPQVDIEQTKTKQASKTKVAKKKPSPPAPTTAPLPPANVPEVAASAAETPSDQTTAQALGSYNPALDLEGVKLPPGTTMTTAGPVQGYRALSAMSSTKTATPIEQIPQSIQVVPQQVIKDQNNLTVKETLQNVSNVTGGNSRSLGDDTTNVGAHKIRGLAAEQWLDGLMVPGNMGDLNAFANVERIEVLKGPSAILYGGGVGAPIAGAVNVVSKLPTDTASAQTGLTFGSHSFVQPWFDVNQPLNASKTILFRLTGEYTKTDDFVDVLEQDRYSINPTLTLTNKSDTTLTVQGRASKVKQQTYQGLPATGTITGNFRIDPQLFIGPSDIERGFSEVQSLTLSFDHKFSSIWSTDIKARISRAESEQNTQLAIGNDISNVAPALAPSTWLLANSELRQEEEEASVSANLQAKFSLGATRNRLLFGGDYSRVRNQGVFNADYLGNAACVFFADCAAPSPITPVDLTNPTFNIPYFDPSLAGQTIDTTSLAAFLFGPIGQFASFSNFNDTYITKGVYGQLQTTLFEKVHLMGGLRLANVAIDHFEGALATPRTTTTDETKLLPRVGIVVDLLPGLSPYASYSEGMKAISSLNLNTPPKPEETVQREVGVKININNQLAGTVAVFEIERNNIPVVTGLAVSALSSQTSRGYEADLIWQPTSSWQILASYGHTDVEYSAPARGIPAGNKVPGVPDDSGRIWVNYKFEAPGLAGWSVGGGVYAASGAYVDTANRYKTSGYHTVDAKIGYDTEKVSAAFNVKNLTGEEYFVPYSFLGGQVAPGDERTYYGSVIVRY